MAEKKKCWTGTLSTCDICNDPFIGKYFVDGKTRHGSWALMCQKCFRAYGVGTAHGLGQKYSTNPPYEKIEG